MGSYRRWSASEKSDKTTDKPTFVGKSSVINRLREKAKLVSDSEAPVMITGENGTGKEVLANLIHFMSDRSEEPMVTVNCGAIPKELVESELFGHEKGAFTGAEHSKEGCFQMADGGTLFLDEIGEMSNQLQVKLLRAVELKSFRKVGGQKTVNVDTRIISATNKILSDQIKTGNFRKDLFYRLNVIELYIPPLRHRKVDIPLLVDHFLNEFQKKYEKPEVEFSDHCMNLLWNYDWPGNVRELKNIVERSIVMTNDRVIESDVLPNHLQESVEEDHKEEAYQLGNDFENYIHVPVGTSIAEVERRVINETLFMVDQNKTKAADILGFSRKTLHNKLETYRQE